jgi:hypothetical protein
MTGGLSQFDKNRSSTIVDENYVVDQIDAGDLSPTLWVRNDWYPKPRVPSGHLGLYAVTCFAGSKPGLQAVTY